MIEFEHPAFRVKNRTKKAHFNPIEACRGTSVWNVRHYEEIAKESLVPIGEAYNEYYLLMISDTGKIYGEYDDTFELFGNSIEEALTTIFSTTG